MKLPFRVYDVFAESPFAGTQIAVVHSESPLEDELKKKLVSEFNHSDTVFVDTSNKASPFSVYNEKGKTKFGAHTTLVAAKTAYQLGMCDAEAKFHTYDLVDNGITVKTFIDNSPSQEKRILFSRAFDFTTDRYVPELSNIASALSTDVKHLSYSRYTPRLVCADTPVLVVPMTKPEHVIAARLDTHQWSSLLSEIYASYILLIARGSISKRADFHGRLIHPDFKPTEYPPIGSVIPEFIAYLCSCEETSIGTHIVTIDRGGYDSRQSVIHTEFDNKGDGRATCRIGGNVVLMSEGEFVYE